jgi:CheY-like chemotaxis protein
MYSVLLAEDSHDDCLLFEVGISRVPGLKLVGNVSDGFETIGYLQGTGDYSDRARFPLPDLLFLDLKMPLMGGFEVLQWLQTGGPKPRVIVLSGSDLPTDVQQAISLGADDFKVKPSTPEEMVKLLQGVLEDARSHLEPGRRHVAACS